MTLAPLLSLIFSCTGTNTAAPVLPDENADIVIAADLDGNGRDELVSVTGERVSWQKQSHALSGTVQTYRVGTTEDGKKEVVLLVTGRSRVSPRAKTAITQIDEAGATRLYIGDQIAERISDLRTEPEGLYVTRVLQGKTAVGAWLRDGEFDTKVRSIMGLQQIPLSDGRFAVGRLYGDQAKEFGGLEIHNPGDDTIVLPVLRGVRTLERYDINRDGLPDLLVADGWHYRYGDEGRARLIAFLGPDYQDRRVLAELDESYTINRIEFIDTVLSEPPKILLHASHGTYLLHPDTVSWRVEPLHTPTPQRSIVGASTGQSSWLLGVDGKPRLLK